MASIETQKYFCTVNGKLKHHIIPYGLEKKQQEINDQVPSTIARAILQLYLKKHKILRTFSEKITVSKH